MTQRRGDREGTSLIDMIGKRKRFGPLAWTLVCVAAALATAFLIIPGVLTFMHVNWYVRLPGRAHISIIRDGEETMGILLGAIWLLGLAVFGLTALSEPRRWRR